MSGGRLRRRVGLAAAVFLLVGNIVGASIFVLPGQLAGVAGPAVFILIAVRDNTLLATSRGTACCWTNCCAMRPRKSHARPERENPLVSPTPRG